MFKQVAAMAILASMSFAAFAQAKVEEAPKAFTTRAAGNFVEVFAPNYKMEPGQRFEDRYIFDIARAYCLSLNTGTKLVSHEPAIYVSKAGSVAGTSFKYRCGR
jgi:hypothetical protein